MGFAKSIAVFGRPCHWIRGLGLYTLFTPRPIYDNQYTASDGTGRLDKRHLDGARGGGMHQRTPHKIFRDAEIDCPLWPQFVR